ncbi:MAG: RluA family pseudouridine synthase [Myxococcota bacterium]
MLILRRMLAEFDLKPVHRLDADTTGVLVFAKSRLAAAKLGKQFEARQVGKTYLARVHGELEEGRYIIDGSIGRNVQARGARRIDDLGAPARSDVEIVGRFGDGTCLLRVHPHSGRTNQIRLHLASCGLPIVGDTVYTTSAVARQRAFSQGAICLHAWRLEMNHPSGESLCLEAPLPEWALGYC